MIRIACHRRRLAVLVAVHCHETGGGQNLDVGFVDVFPALKWSGAGQEAPSAARKDDSKADGGGSGRIGSPSPQRRLGSRLSCPAHWRKQ